MFADGTEQKWSHTTTKQIITIATLYNSSKKYEVPHFMNVTVFSTYVTEENMYIKNNNGTN